MASVGKIRRFEDLSVFTMTGTVVGHQGRTSTRTSAQTTTNGGNNYFAPTTSTTVSTSSTHHQRLFVQKDDGEEFDVEFAGMDMGVREGQRVTVVCAGPKSTGRGHPMAIVNHASKSQQMFNERVKWILSSWIKPLLLGWGALLVILLILSRGNLGGISIPLLLIVGGVLAWEIYRWLTLYRKVRLTVEETATEARRNPAIAAA